MTKNKRQIVKNWISEHMDTLEFIKETKSSIVYANTNTAKRERVIFSKFRDFEKFQIYYYNLH